jgi:hypothetical protein
MSTSFTPKNQLKLIRYITFGTLFHWTEIRFGEPISPQVSRSSVNNKDSHSTSFTMGIV